jgi:hypothetical protein
MPMALGVAQGEAAAHNGLLVDEQKRACMLGKVGVASYRPLLNQVSNRSTYIILRGQVIPYGKPKFPG